MQLSVHNWANNYLTDNLPRNAHFWQVGLLDVALSEYLNESHNFRNLIFMTSSLSYSAIGGSLLGARHKHGLTDHV